MKALFINGSPRKNWNSTATASETISGTVA